MTVLIGLNQRKMSVKAISATEGKKNTAFENFFLVWPQVKLSTG